MINMSTNIEKATRSSAQIYFTEEQNYKWKSKDYRNQFSFIRYLQSDIDQDL